MWLLFKKKKLKSLIATSGSERSCEKLVVKISLLKYYILSKVNNMLHIW